MTTSRSGTRRLGGYFALVAGACVAAAALVTVQGCTCTWFMNHCRVQSVVIFVKECPAGTRCVSWAPETTHVYRSSFLMLVNATGGSLTVQPSVRGVFEEGNEITIEPGATRHVRISKGASNGRVMLKITGATPDLCPGLPGPGMDIDG